MDKIEKNISFLTFGIIKPGLKRIIPYFVIRWISGFFYGWRGNYSTWDDAKMKCTGYATDEIFNKVISSSLLIRDGKKPYERDSVVFDKIRYSETILSGILLASSRKNDKLNVIDYGGALGSSYFQNIRFLKYLNGINWSIIEQEGLVEAGKIYFANEQLHFFNSMEECINRYPPDVVIFSSVLQYLEEPYKILERVIDLKPDLIIVDRTPFIKKEDRITIQKVHPSIYKAKYPCWFFNEEKFVNFFKGYYSLIEEFEALDRANLKSDFKGFIFIKKND